MSKQQASNHKDRTTGRSPSWGAVIGVAVACALVPSAVMLYSVMNQMDTLSGSMLTLQRQIANVSEQTKANSDRAARMEDEEAFNQRVIGAFQAYVAHQQKEKAQQKMAAYKAADTTPPEGRKVYGSLNARFTLVEFSDIECPFCKRFHATPKKIVDASGGEVNWEWKHLPLAFHNPGAQVGAHATECVAEQKGNIGFWAFLEDLFEATRGNGQGAPNLVELASGIGADADKFTECMQSGRYQDKVNADLQEAQNRGINGTPATFIVDNRTGNVQLLSGAQPEAAFLSTIERMKEDAS